MSDIVERLRSRKEPCIEVDLHYPQIVDSDTLDAECIEAADEITRLRARVAELEKALEWLTDRLVEDFNGGEALHRWELNRARAALAKTGER